MYFSHALIGLVSTGVLGEYIGRIYNETKNRPTYVIRNKIGTPGAVLLPLAKVERPEYPPRHLQA